jgi:hypothetical protein
LLRVLIVFVFLKKIDEWPFWFFRIFTFSIFLGPFCCQICTQKYYSIGNFIFYHNLKRK